MKTLSLALFGLAVAVLLGQQPNASSQPEASPATGAAIHPPWSSTQVLTPAELAKQLKNSDAKIIQVGFANLYKVKHIPGSVYAGPGRNEAGLEELQKAVADVPKDRQIILYCGCCPWDHCPNMKPAFSLLKSLGYTKIKVMEIPTNFGVDWVDRGYPIEGSATSPQ